MSVRQKKELITSCKLLIAGCRLLSESKVAQSRYPLVVASAKVFHSPLSR